MPLLLSPLSKQLHRFRLMSLGLSAAMLAPTGFAFGQTAATPAGLVADTTNSTNTTVLLDAVNHAAIVSNGLQSGGNLYHRFSEFDTTRSQDNLSRVLFSLPNNTAIENLIVGVSATTGSLISVPIVLSQAANLIFMSPYGIVMSGAAGFGVGSAIGDITPLAKVAITTANKVDFTNNTTTATTASSFEVIQTTFSPATGYPDGSPNPQTGLMPLDNLGGKILLDGQTNGPVSLVVDQALMIAELVPSATPQTPASLAPVQVKGQVTLAIPGTGTIAGAFNLGEWSTSNNAWSTASLIATTGSGSLSWTAPVAVKPGSEFKLQTIGKGVITLTGLVNLFGLEANANTFAKLVNTSGDNIVAGGIELFGPGRIELQAGAMQINAAPTIGISANYSNNSPSTNHWGAANNAYNLLFITAPATTATVNGAISLGNGGVTKQGDGNLNLISPNNSYTGPTQVAGGYLQVNGPVPASASCSGGGNSNVCSAQPPPSGDPNSGSPDPNNPMDFGAAPVQIVLGLGPGNGPGPGGPEGNSFDLQKGEGRLKAPGLNVNVAVNNSFVMTDSEEKPPESNVSSASGAPADQGPQDPANGMGPGPTDSVVSSVSSEQASAVLSTSDSKATEATLKSLAPELLSGGIPATPTPQQFQEQMRRQVQLIRSGADGLSSGQLRSQRSDQSSWIASTALISTGPALPSFQRKTYQPAVVHLRFSEERPSSAAQSKGTDAFLDITLIPLDGPVEGRRVEVSKKRFMEQLRELYSSLSRQDPIDHANPKSAARQLFNQLIGPIAPQLKARGVTTLLISADRGLQAIPFAALHDGSQYFGERFGFAITPSLALTNLSASESGDKPLLVAGASTFDGLAPLPLVPQEVRDIGGKTTASVFLNRDFTPEVLLEKATDPRYSRIHIATHAEFLPGGPSASYLYSGVGPIPLSAFNRLRLQRKGVPLDLITFSACRTALGDPNSELGFAGLAVQAGARSAAGTLWYVDDVASSAYFEQMYRYLDQGVPKAEALQLTRQAFLRRFVHLEGDRLLGPNGALLLQNLTKEQQRRVQDGLQHPYFWAGFELVGSPW